MLVPRNAVFKIPEQHRAVLEDLYVRVTKTVHGMIKNRELHSSKYWKDVPCIIANSLIRKYQRNHRLKQVNNIIIPVCGAKGIHIKLVDGGFRIPPVFKKVVIPAKFPWAFVGPVRSVEIFKREGTWYASACVNVECEKEIKVTGVVGVDRNSRGNVAVMADPQNGRVLKLGIDPAGTKKCLRGRRANLQKEKKYALLKKMRQQTSRRMKFENHKASRTIVDYAAQHCRTIVLERLSGISSGRCRIRKYVESNQWAFAQLENLILYKAALRGVPVLHVDPRYTSQMCSRCGKIQKPDEKRYKCASCGHKDHRDANAAFNIGRLGAEVVRATGGDILSVVSSGSSDGPYAGKDSAQCGLDDQNSVIKNGNTSL